MASIPSCAHSLRVHVFLASLHEPPQHRDISRLTIDVVCTYCRIHECPSTADIKHCIAFIQHEAAGDVILTDDALLISKYGFDLTTNAGASNTLPLSLLISAYGSGNPPHGATRVRVWNHGVFYPSGQDWGDSPSGVKIDTFVKTLISKRTEAFQYSFSTVKPQPREVAKLLAHYDILLRAQKHHGQSGSDDDPLLFDRDSRAAGKKQKHGQKGR